jgi:uncharacterized repeat protein (TIGR01451 family)
VKQALFYLKRLPKRFAMAAAIASAVIALPLSSTAADYAQLEGSIGVANMTRNETNYAPSTSASYNEVVKFSVYYHNRELSDSGKVAENLKIDVDMPTEAGRTQTVTVRIAGDNTNTVTDRATVNLNREDARLEFIPGSVYWKHNKGTRENMNYVTEKVADSYLNGRTIIEDVKPCFEYESTITFQARVIVPSVSITKKVRQAGQGQAVTSMNVKPGDRLEYLLTAKNLGNEDLTDVTMRDQLPANITYVPGTVKLFNGPHPNGVVINNDFLFKGGVNAGSVGPGATVYITFEADVADVSKLACGQNTLKNIVVVDTDQTGEYNNSATVTANKECNNVSTPTYSCDVLKLTKGDNRTVTVSEFKTSQNNGATFKDVVINWGDSTDNLTTNNPVGQKHQYAKDGDYTVRATARFNVNGQVKEATSESCVVKVNFSTTPGKPTTPTVLPNTGAGDVAGLFAAVTVAGAVAHRLVLARRFDV